MLKLVHSIRPHEKKKHTLASPLRGGEGSPGASPRDRRKISKANGDKNSDNDDDDIPSKKSPKSSPTLKATVDFNNSYHTLAEDDEEYEQMTNIEKIFYKIRHQLEIVDMYTNTSNNDDDDNIYNNDITNNTTTVIDKNYTKVIGNSHRNISFEKTDNTIDMMTTDMNMVMMRGSPVTRNIRKKKIKNDKIADTNINALYKLCDTEFL